MRDTTITTQWVIAFGYKRTIQCKAKSKRSGQRCRRPASKGKSVCHIHGGRSTGPRTAAGKATVAQVNTVHGRETRLKRVQRSEKMRELRLLEEQLRRQGRIMGKRTPGRRSEKSVANGNQ